MRAYIEYPDIEEEPALYIEQYWNEGRSFDIVAIAHRPLSWYMEE